MATKKKTLWNFFDSFEGDKITWIIVLLLIMFSVVCLFSATPRLAIQGDTSRLDIIKEHFFVIALGLGLIILCYNIKSLNFFRRASKCGFAVSFVLLAILDLKLNLGFIRASSINGAYRVLVILGQQLHVFEVVKVAMVMYLAWAMEAYNKDDLKWGRNKKEKLAIYVFAPMLLIFLMVLPGSNTSALLIGAVMLMTIIFGGVKLKGILIAGASLVICCGGVLLVHKISGKSFGRLDTAISRIFDNTDWEKEYQRAREEGDRVRMQEALDELRQGVGAKIAIKEGKVFGKGPGQSTQRYVVPAISEDYMLSFIIEEYGVLVGLFVVILYISLLARSSIIVNNCAKEPFAQLAVAGLTVLISGQALIHILVNADLGVMTGQTLPLISKGNTAFLAFSLAFGIILSMSRMAYRGIEKDTKNADPLMEYTGKGAEENNREDELNALDRFESEIN